MGRIKNKLKTRDVGEGHQLSTSAGHHDIPALSVTPQDSSSAEWASLPRLSLLPSKATATVPNLQLLSPLPILHPGQGEQLPMTPLSCTLAGRGDPNPSSFLHVGQGLLTHFPSLTLAGRGAPSPSPPAPRQGGLCHRDPGALVLPNLLSLLQGQG